MNTRPLAALLLAAAVTSAANGDEVMSGDVVRNAAPPAIMYPTPQRTEVLSSDLHFKSWLYTGDSVAFDSVGNLYAAGETTLECTQNQHKPASILGISHFSGDISINSAGILRVARLWSGGMRLVSSFESKILLRATFWAIGGRHGLQRSAGVPIVVDVSLVPLLPFRPTLHGLLCVFQNAPKIYGRRSFVCHASPF